MREITLSSGKAQILPGTYRNLIRAQKSAQYEGEAIMSLIPEVVRFPMPDGTLYTPSADDTEKMPFDDVILLEEELLRTTNHRPVYPLDDPTLATLASGQRVRMHPVLASDMMAARRLAQNPFEVSVYMIERCVHFEEADGTFATRIFEDILDNSSLQDGLGLQSLLFDRDEKKTQALKSQRPLAPWQSPTSTSPDSSITDSRTPKSKR
jgi:hypothetical protein